MWNHAELLVVVACGNAGSGGMGTVGSPAAAKNALTVGNGYSTRDGSNPENLNISSSRGPTKDYRIKPEIVAPGTRIFSTRSSKCSKDPISGNAYYTEMTGTSMATPLVSGAAALVRQWLADRRGYTGLPSSALLKAILTGGGTAMTGSCGSEQIPAALPNNYIGWGRLNLEETLYPTNGRAVKFADWIPFHDGDSEIIDLTTTNAAPLDVQLCWIDHAADLSAARTLINDLDLIVSNKTTGAVWYGNGIAGGDHTNTTESVRLATGDAPAGDYAVIVRGYSVSYDSDVGGAAAVYIRGAFESETKPDPEYVRNVRAGVSYEFLDEALKEVQSGDTLEVLQPVELTKSVTLSVPCTIVATNADPLASLVTRTNGAAITLASGAELTLTNLVFVSSDDSTAVSASAGSRLILSGTVGVGMVAIEDAEGVLFRAPLAFAGDRISVNATNGFAIGAAFGHWTGEYLSASNAASHVINLLNEELGGIAEKMTGRLVWGVVPCDPADAKCVVEGDGIPATYCRTFSQALQVALQQDSTLTVKKSASMTLSATLTHNLTLAGDGGSLAFSSDAPTAGFVIPQGTAMTVSNLVVSGAGVKLKDCAFKVTGGELTLESGATLQGLSNAYQYQGKPWGGAIVVTAGTVTMNTGSGIANCVAHSAAAGGGAIYLGTKTATANLFGGMISGCSATKGGAVYAWGNSTTGAWVNIKGNFTAKGNTNPDGSRPSNVFLAHNAILTVPDHLQPAGSKRTIGLTFGNRDGQLDKNANGNRFTVRHDGGLPTAGGKSGADTARHFFSDSNADLQGEYVVDSGCYFFQWGLATAEPPTAPFPGANVWIEQSAGKNYYYRDLNEALADLSWEAPMYVFNILGDILLTNDVEISKNVVLQRDASLDSNPPIYRKNNAMYKILPGGSLAVANVALYGITAEEYSSGYSQSTKGLIWADGGSLTLGSGAFVGYVWGRASRAANAITVSGGGTLTMESGSSIAYTQNSYVNKSDATGTGGAILLDGATAYLRGGTIEQCKAFRGGALYVANGSTAYVSGDFTARNNFDLTNGVDCVVVSKNSDLILAGELTGWVGVNEGLACDTNWFGTASKDWAWDVDTLTNSAAHFIHDKRDVAGAAVTNATGEAVLVWSDWISRAGKYVSPDGDVYRICLAPGQSVVVPQGFSVEPKTSADGRTVLSLEGGVEGCWYTVYSTTDLAQPFAAETSIQLKPGETFEYEIKPSDAARFYKIIAEEGIK